MATIRTADDINKLGTIMGVWAHPDDETFTSAGIMAAASQNGQTVVCVTATRGESGAQDESRWPAIRLGEIRESELEAALGIMGVNGPIFLGYDDGGCVVDTPSAVSKLQNLINHYKPDTILTFGKNGLTGHPDHKAVYAWVLAAVSNSTVLKPVVYHAALSIVQYEQGMREIDKVLNYFYNVTEPQLMAEGDCDIYFDLNSGLTEVKYKALKAMPSQYGKLFEEFSKDKVCEAFSTEVFIRQK